MKRTTLVSLSCIALLFTSFSNHSGFKGGPPPWRESWSLPPGFEMEIDSQGFTLPSAIAFVPNPGNHPMDPLYFVTELRGSVKVVTNDRTVLTFAEDFFEGDPSLGLEEQEDEFGLAGICLAPDQGYVFVTFTYKFGDDLFNNIVRFESEPHEFGLEASGMVSFSGIFEEFPTGISHQIGGCEVVEEQLFVSVGDGFDRYEPPLAIEIPLGKVLRMSLDGQPLTDNPFFDDQDLSSPANYVWAYGLRNPFGIQAMGDRLFVTDNGPRIDRFVEVLPGQDYLWDGSDYSIGSSALATFFPALGPAQMDFAAPIYTAFPPEYRSTFFVARSKKDASGVFAIPFTQGESEIERVPSIFIDYLSERQDDFSGVVAATAIGPDGLYFAPLLPDISLEEAVIYRVYYNFDTPETQEFSISENPEALIETYACLACHSLGGEGSFQAPSLDRHDLIESLFDYLHSQEYEMQVQELRENNAEIYGPYEEMHNLIVEANGLDKIRTWITYRLVDPRFDDPNAVMPNLGLTLEEARLIANYLVPDPSPLTEQISDLPSTIKTWVVSPLPGGTYLHIGLAFTLGLLIGLVGIRLRNKSK